MSSPRKAKTLYELSPGAPKDTLLTNVWDSTAYAVKRASEVIGDLMVVTPFAYGDKAEWLVMYREMYGPGMLEDLDPIEKLCDGKPDWWTPKDWSALVDVVMFNCAQRQGLSPCDVSIGMLNLGATSAKAFMHLYNPSDKAVLPNGKTIMALTTMSGVLWASVCLAWSKHDLEALSPWDRVVYNCLMDFKRETLGEFKSSDDMSTVREEVGITYRGFGEHRSILCDEYCTNYAQHHMCWMHWALKRAECEEAQVCMRPYPRGRLFHERRHYGEQFALSVLTRKAAADDRYCQGIMKLFDGMFESMCNIAEWDSTDECCFTLPYCARY